MAAGRGASLFGEVDNAVSALGGRSRCRCGGALQGGAGVRGYVVILVAAAVGIACGQAATPTAPSSASGQVSTGFFTSGAVQLSYRLDVPAHTAPVGAVVFGHGSGMADERLLPVFGLADGFVSRGFATLCFDKRGVGQSTGQYIPVDPQNSARCSRISPPTWRRAWSSCAAGRRSIGIASVSPV